MGVSPHPLELKIEIAQLSDPGRDPNKQINEDSCGHSVTKFGHLAVLCDGMGGHYGGQEASRRAITTIFEQIENVPDTLTPAEALKQAIEVAARRVYELGGPPENKVRPGSTVVAMLLHDGGIEVGHVGDSRAYVIRSGQIYPLTRDHSMVQAMIDAGFLTEDQAIGHPDANKITRALGMKPDVDVEVRPEPMELFPGDVLITSSDGLTDLALPKDILGATRQALASGTLDFACQQLVRMANDRGGHDNITVQLIRVVSTAPRKTRTGATQAGVSATLSENQGHQGAGGHHAGHHGGGHVVAGPHVAPTAVDTIAGHHPSPTHPQAAAATAHDGTSRHSHAAAPAPLGPGGTHIMEPTPAAGLVNYRADNPGGLPLPPASMSPASMRPGGAYPTPNMSSAAPQAMPPGAMALPPAMASSPGRFVPPAPMSYPGGSGVDSAGSRSGGNVLFLALAISFVVAVVMVALAWVLFFR